MNRFLRLSMRTAALLAALVVAGVAEQVDGVGIYDYQFERSFTLPAPPTQFANVLFDALPDGRLLRLNDTTVAVETAPKSATFVTLGNIPGFSPISGPSFLAISPDGTHAAAGANGSGSVAVFSTSNPTLSTNYTVGDLGGEWLSNNLLATSSGFGSAKVEITTLACGEPETVCHPWLPVGCRTAPAPGCKH